MKVKIEDKIYDSTDQPIMVILSNSDKNNISNMLEYHTKYASFPKEECWTTIEIDKWMDSI